MKERILIAEDEQVLRTSLCDLLEEAGYEVDGAADGKQALEMILSADYAVVLSDLRMPNMDGITLLKHIVDDRPETSVLITTAYASVETAVEALRFGAFDYVLKPVVFEELLQKLQNLFAYRALKKEVVRLRRDVHSRTGFEGIVGASPPIREVFDLVEKVGPTQSVVLITGESGTGKELVARAVHACSAIRDREFLPVNIAAIPKDMLEAQLFGHEKGAFTGAHASREGILAGVRGGSVFLDEIGDLQLSSQSKLLRALEAHEVFPLGAQRPKHVDFRLIIATNQDLEAAVAKGTFRQDLFFRLNVFRIELPPLRERREDIPVLVSHFLRLHSKALGGKPPAPSNQTMKLLLAYDWPGNVRELSNVIERACILADGQVVQVEHLPTDLHADGRPSLAVGLREAVQQFECRHIQWVLRAAEGNREQAARMLQIDPATLYRRLAKYDIE